MNETEWCSAYSLKDNFEPSERGNGYRSFDTPEVAVVNQTLDCFDPGDVWSANRDIQKPGNVYPLQ